MTPAERTEATRRREGLARWLRANQGRAGSNEYAQIAQAFRHLDSALEAKQPPRRNAFAGLIEGGAGLLDLALGAGGQIAENQVRYGVTPGVPVLSEPVDPEANVQAPLVGPAITESLELNPDRDSFGYRAGAVAGGGVTGGAPGIVRQGIQAGVRAVPGAARQVLTKEGLAGAAGGGLGLVAEEGAVTMGAPPVVGQMVGEAVGSLVPGGGRQAGAELISRVGGDADSAPTLDAMNRQDVTPSGGAVGNRGMGYVENALGLVPGLGARVHGRQQRQLDELSGRIGENAVALRTEGAVTPPQPATVRGSEGAEMPVTQEYTETVAALPQTTGPRPADLGAQVREISQEGLARYGDEISRREDALSGAIGARTPIDMRAVRNRIQDLHRSAAPRERAVLEAELRDLDTMRRESPRYRNVERSLKQARAQLTKLTNQKTPDPVAVATAQQQVDDLQRQLDNIWEIPYEQARNWRSGVGLRTRDTTLKGGAEKQIYGTTTDQFRRAAADVSPEWAREFDALMSRQSAAQARKGSLAEGGDVPTARARVDTQTDDALYSWVFGGSQKPAEKIEFLARMAGGVDTPRFRQFIGDVYEHMGHATPGQQSATSTKFSPNTFISNWAKLDDKTKGLMAAVDPELAQDLDDVVIIADALKRRGQAANPSGTTAVALPAAIGAGLATQPVATLGTVAAGAGIVETILSRAFSNAIARGGTIDPSRFIGQYVGRAGAIGAPEEEEPTP